LTEQIRLANSQRFGRHTEKMSQPAGQISFDENGNLYFNEPEALVDQCPEPVEPTIETVIKKRTSRPKGKREEDLKDIPVDVLPTRDVSEEDRIRMFGSLDNCRRMDDDVYRRLVYIPAGWKVEEVHVAVYRSTKGEPKFVKGETPSYLLRGSLVSSSLEAAIINGKYVNALPYRRMEKDFQMNGVHISEQNMASWTVKCAERYLSRMYNYLHDLLITYHVLQADETVVEVSKDGRKAGTKSYMWVYRTGQGYVDRPIVLYEYQKTRNSEHPLNFLKGFDGYLVCDGFSGYKTLNRKAPRIHIAECWAHARRKFTDAVKASKAPSPSNVASQAIQLIGAIYHADNQLKDLSAEQRQRERQRKVKPLVDAFFSWLHKMDDDPDLLLSDYTQKGINYCFNQEQYLRTFLEDGDVPMDNNRTEGTIRPFTIGRRNWMMIDTLSGASASAVIYSLVESAKASGLNTYYYFDYLLSELPKQKEFTGEEEELETMERLAPWSKTLPEKCYKRGR
ncbi:MAG: IS66 family transposase, partial [Eubacterium sp.]|nr:IS66 family transposase [Eubacterium sp.]